MKTGGFEQGTAGQPKYLVSPLLMVRRSTVFVDQDVSGQRALSRARAL